MFLRAFRELSTLSLADFTFLAYLLILANSLVNTAFIFLADLAIFLFFPALAFDVLLSTNALNLSLIFLMLFLTALPASALANALLTDFKAILTSFFDLAAASNLRDSEICLKFLLNSLLFNPFLIEFLTFFAYFLKLTFLLFIIFFIIFFIIDESTNPDNFALLTTLEIAVFSKAF